MPGPSDPQFLLYGNLYYNQVIRAMLGFFSYDMIREVVKSSWKNDDEGFEFSEAPVNDDFAALKRKFDEERRLEWNAYMGNLTCTERLKMLNDPSMSTYLRIADKMRESLRDVFYLGLRYIAIGTLSGVLGNFVLDKNSPHEAVPGLSQDSDENKANNP